jgi:hypothetical protein
MLGKTSRNDEKAMNVDGNVFFREATLNPRRQALPSQLRRMVPQRKA